MTDKAQRKLQELTTLIRNIPEGSLNNRVSNFWTLREYVTKELLQPKRMEFLAILLQYHMERVPGKKVYYATTTATTLALLLREEKDLLVKHVGFLFAAKPSKLTRKNRDKKRQGGAHFWPSTNSLPTAVVERPRDHFYLTYSQTEMLRKLLKLRDNLEHSELFSKAEEWGSRGSLPWKLVCKVQRAIAAYYNKEYVQSDLLLMEAELENATLFSSSIETYVLLQTTANQRSCGHLDSLSENINRLTELIQENKMDNLIEGEASYNVGAYYDQIREFEKAIIWYKRASDLFFRSNYPNEYCRTQLRHLGALRQLMNRTISQQHIGEIKGLANAIFSSIELLKEHTARRTRYWHWPIFGFDYHSIQGSNKDILKEHLLRVPESERSNEEFQCRWKEIDRHQETLQNPFSFGDVLESSYSQQKDTGSQEVEQ